MRAKEGMEMSASEESALGYEGDDRRSSRTSLGIVRT
jgi:hypothetical protein